MPSEAADTLGIDPTLLACARTVFDCGQRVLQELGAGFSEQVLQAALAIEFNERGISYLREPHIEVLYRGQCVGLDRPDFVVWIGGDGTEKAPAVVLEVKQADRTQDDHRQQLVAYLRALATTRAPRLVGTTIGLLLRFPRADQFSPWEGMLSGGIELEMWSRDPVTGAIARQAVLPEV